MGVFDGVVGEDGTFTATGITDESEVTAIVVLEEVVDGGGDERAIDIILGFLSNEFLEYCWVGGGGS
ncbi:MAG: hypothetical protein F6K17_39620 [Okeania sp. SIO3C4]|nr:hypothetical protein [Okeania sp. SIO3C4]